MTAPNLISVAFLVLAIATVALTDSFDDNDRRAKTFIGLSFGVGIFILILIICCPILCIVACVIAIVCVIKKWNEKQKAQFAAMNQPAAQAV